MADTHTASPTARVSSLDSVRGLAALSVVVCHYLLALLHTDFGRELWRWLWIPPFALLTTAYGSVILFFVLSGYVLALSLLGEKRPSWFVFAVRRFFRIWPAYAITLVVAFVLADIGWGHGRVNVAGLLNQLAMTSSNISLDLPAWSLVHELRISLAFPLLLVCVLRAPAISIAASFALQLAGRNGPPWLATWIPDTATYIVYFCVGAWLAVHRDWLSGLLRRASLPVKVAICFPALIVLSVPFNLWYAGMFTGVGASLIIATVAASPGAHRALSARWCEWLGRVSYSLYLTHLVVLVALYEALRPHLTVGWILVIATPIIGAIAAAGYRWIELPSIAVGRPIAAALEVYLLRARAFRPAARSAGV